MLTRFVLHGKCQNELFFTSLQYLERDFGFSQLITPIVRVSSGGGGAGGGSFPPPPPQMIPSG